MEFDYSPPNRYVTILSYLFLFPHEKVRIPSVEYFARAVWAIERLVLLHP